MAGRRSYFSDPRHRFLAVLAAAALLSVLLALLAVRQQAAELSPKFAPEQYFPGLASQVRNAARIHIATKRATVDVARVPQGAWVVLQRRNYPASFEQVQKLLVGLAALETIEPKTSRPEWFHYVDLNAPPRGNGTLIQVSDAAGHTLAAAIFGAIEDIGDPGGAIGLFARKPSNNQSWLLRSVFEPKGDPGDWLDKTVVTVDRARIQEVDVRPASGTAYIVRRAKPSDPNFALATPKGRELSSPATTDGVVSALTGFTFDDVRQASQLDFAGASRLVTKTFDGLSVTASIVRVGPDYWLQLTATGDPLHPDAAREARDIVARAGHWAYKLPAYKGQQFMTTLESLLKPPVTPAKDEE
jgi:hypothetical protein